MHFGRIVRVGAVALVLGPDGSLAIYDGQPVGTTHVIVDVTGWID